LLASIEKYATAWLEPLRRPLEAMPDFLQYYKSNFLSKSAFFIIKGASKEKSCHK